MAKNKTKTEKKSTVVLFGVAEEFTPEFKKERKGLAAVLISKIKYLLYLEDKKSSIPSGYTPKYIALCIYDTDSQNFSRSFAYSKKNNEILFFNISNESVPSSITIDTKSTKKDITESEIRELAENHFMGNPYCEIIGSEKELSKQYEDSPLALVVTLLGTVLMLGYLGYFMMFDSDDAAIQSPAPQPYEQPLSAVEQNKLKNSLSLQIIEKIADKIDGFKDRKKFDIQRIASVQVGVITEIPFSIPALNPDTNRWEFASPEQERFKRGGFSSSLEFTHQKKYPSVGYTLEDDGNEEKIPLYRKIETVNLSLAGIDLQDANFTTSKKLDKGCLDSTLYLASSVLPSSNDEQYLYFKIKKAFPYNLYYELREIFTRCPLEIENMAISNGVLESNIKMLKTTDGAYK